MIKRVITKLFEKFGYRISRSPDKLLFLDYAKYAKESIENKRFYNVGAGSFFHPYWTNIDFVSDWYSKLQTNVVHHDLMKLEPLPILTSTAEIIYTSHTIEHVSEDAVRNLFREAFKALKQGGVFRVTTGPDAELDWRALKAGDSSWFYWDEWYKDSGTYEDKYFNPPTSSTLQERWLHHVSSQLVSNDISPSKVKLTAEQISEIIESKDMESSLNYFTSLCEFNPERPGNHITWWSYEKINQFLREAGFTNVYRSGYGQSISPILRNVNIFDNTHPQMSVYCEALK